MCRQGHILDGGMSMLTTWEKFERAVVLVAVIVLMLDLLYWRPY